MPRHFFKQYAPDDKVLRDHKHMKLFGDMLHDPNLWHFNRRSVSGAFAVGLFWAMMPIPLQMVCAAACAIFLRVNLPVSILLVWITNPLTIPPIFYFNYKVGDWLTGGKYQCDEFQVSLDWLMDSIGEIWQPLFLGSFVVGVLLAVTGYLSIRLFWRLHVIRHYKRRRDRIRNFKSRIDRT